jgi:hypothetical protein
VSVLAGRVHKLRIQPGPGAQECFQRQVRELLGLPPDGAFDVTFECKAPTTGVLIGGQNSC